GKDAEELGGESEDSYVQFKKEFHLLIDSDQDKETLKKRATNEANRRKGEGLSVTLRMSTGSDDGGELWKGGRKHQVVIPVDQVNDELQIQSVEFALDADTRETTVTLVSPETYTDDTQSSGKDGGKSASGGGNSPFSSGISSGTL